MIFEKHPNWWFGAGLLAWLALGICACVVPGAIPAWGSLMVATAGAIAAGGGLAVILHAGQVNTGGVSLRTEPPRRRERAPEQSVVTPFQSHRRADTFTSRLLDERQQKDNTRRVLH